MKLIKVSRGAYCTFPCYDCLNTRNTTSRNKPTLQNTGQWLTITTDLDISGSYSSVGGTAAQLADAAPAADVDAVPAVKKGVAAEAAPPVDGDVDAASPADEDVAAEHLAEMPWT